jgi:Tfp pilus assembly protein PilO
MKNIYTIIIILVVGGLGFFVAYPQYQRKAALDSEIEFLKTSLESNKKYSNELSSLKEKIEAKEEMQKINIALPIEEPISEVFRFLEKQAENNGVAISDIGFVVQEPDILPSEGQFSTQPQGTTSGEVVFSEPNFNEITAVQTQDILSRKASRNFKLETIKITFRTKGSYQAIKNFIVSLEKSVRLIKFASIEIEGGKKDEKEGKSDLLEASISAKVFNYKIIKK